MTGKDKILEQLSAYIDGELSDAARKEVEKIVKADPDLAAELRHLQTVRKMLRDLPPQHPGEDFVSGVLAQAERRRLVESSADQHPTTGMGWVRWLASAAVLLIVVGIGTVVTVVLYPPTWSERMAGIEEPQATVELARDVRGVTETKLSPRREGASEKDISAAPGEKPASRGPSEESVRRGRALHVESFAAPEGILKEAHEPGEAVADGTSVKQSVKPPQAFPGPKAPASVESGTALAESTSVKSVPTPRMVSPAKGVAPRELKVHREAPKPPPRPHAGEPVPTVSKRYLGKVKVEVTEGPSGEGGPELRIRRVPPLDEKEMEILRERGLKGLLGFDKVAAPPEPETRPVAGDEEALPEELAGALNEVVYSDDLQIVQKQVEQLLDANNILPLVIGGRAAGDADRLRWGRLARVSNFAQLARRGRDRVQYVAYVNSEQMKRITGGLKVIRDSQTVSQLPLAETVPEFVGLPRPSSAPGTLPATSGPIGSTKTWIAIEDVGGRLQLRRRGHAPAAAMPTGVGDIQLLLITLDYRERGGPAPVGAREPSRALND